jgi:hypothetical protein
LAAKPDDQTRRQLRLPACWAALVAGCQALQTAAHERCSPFVDAVLQDSTRQQHRQRDAGDRISYYKPLGTHVLQAPLLLGSSGSKLQSCWMSCNCWQGCLQLVHTQQSRDYKQQHSCINCHLYR